jgi:predicted ABC-type ATPase
MKPVFYLLAGPNGAGKSTLYKALQAAGKIAAAAEFVNADLYEAQSLQHIQDPTVRSEAARQWADARRGALLREGKSFVSETVFSHESKLELIQTAQASGFVVLLFVVCMDNPKRLLQRVQQRVAEGGHDVPSDRVLARYPRTLQNLQQAVRMADAALLHDTGDGLRTEHLLVATCRGALTQIIATNLPIWAQQVLDQTPRA